MKKEERDSFIELKLNELKKKRSELIERLEKLDINFSTNLRLVFPESKDVIVLRVIKDKMKLINIVGQLLNYQEIYRKGFNSVYPGKEFKEELIISNYKLELWINDIKKLLEKLDLEEELDKVDKGIEQLPNFYSMDKKDELEFNKLLDILK